MTIMQRYVLGVGVVLFILGAALGLLIPVSVDGTSGAQSCGAPWTGSQPLVVDLMHAHPTDYTALCMDARQPRGLIAVVVAGVGVIVAGAACAWSMQTRTSKKPGN